MSYIAISLPDSDSPRKDPLAFILFPFYNTQRKYLKSAIISPSASDPLIYFIITSILHRVLVVPITNITPDCFHLQLYLLTAFHLGWLSFIGHAMLMPLVLIQLAYILGAEPFCAVLGLFWFAAALWSGRKLWALITCGLTYTIYLLAPIIGPLNPLSPPVTLCLLSFLIALSHGGELLYPPRAASNLSNWIRLSEMKKKHGLLYFAGHVFFSLICGTFQEGVASTRLLPYFFLKLMVHLDYKDSSFIKVERAARILMKTERAAVDFIGFVSDQTGALSADQLERLNNMTVEERIQNFRMVLSACRLEQFFKENGHDVNELKELEAMLSDPEIWDEPMPIVSKLAWLSKFLWISG